MRYGAGLAALVVVLGACSDDQSPVGVATATTEQARGALLADAGYARTDLGTLGGLRSYASDINDRGIVVGWSETASGEVHAFRWTAGRGMVDLGALPGHSFSQATGIVNAWLPNGGQVVGVSGGPDGLVPVIWSTSGAIRVLDIPLPAGASFAFPLDMNVWGAIAGWVDAGSPHAFAWMPGLGSYDLTGSAPVSGFEGSAFAVTDLGRVGVTTQAFGACGSAIGSCWRTFVWSPAAGYQAIGTPGGETEVAVVGDGMNGAGTVVGSYLRADLVAQPYRWRAGTGIVALPIGIDAAASRGAYATSVNERGRIVGRVLDGTTGTVVPLMWPSSGGVMTLAQGNTSSAVPLAINESNVVAGWAVVADGVEHAVIWRPAGTSSGVRAERLAEGSRRFAPSPAGECLTRPDAGASRGALFSCMAAARGR